MRIATLRKPYLPHRRRLPQRKPPFVLQERDMHILQAVFENRFLTFSMLALLFPPDLARTPAHLRKANPTHPNTNLARRLSKLFHHGCVDRVRTIRGGELIYALGQNGSHLLRSRQLPLFVPDTDWAEKNRDVGQHYIDHALMVARFRVALTCALPLTTSTTLENFQRESRELKAEWKHDGARVYVIPDAFLALRDAAKEPAKQCDAGFLEADQSTMTLTKIRDKFMRYSLMFSDRVHQEHFKIPHARVLFVAKSAARAANILTLLTDEKTPAVAPEHRAQFFVTSEENYLQYPTNILAATWRSADKPQELRSIIPSPLPRCTAPTKKQRQ
jgi:hypothetical protein